MSRPIIGIFDSGFGGLTVMRALLALVPQADYVYLGDTARLPYGSKSRETIARYAVGSAHFLENHGADLLVIACNTASALALDALEAEAKIPVLGVIEPGADAAARAATPGQPGVLVLATQATVQSHAYARACAAHGLQAFEKACPLLVPMVEEGWNDHPVTEEVLRIYLEEALHDACEQGILPATVLLGCTHYPLLQPLLERVLRKHFPPAGNAPEIRILDSAAATAQRVAARFMATPISKTDTPACEFFATDSVDKFQRLGSRFLGQPIAQVQHVDLGG
ncbi:MAG TPA: glutamate racemase [Acidobacteriaceae bacterium]